MSTTLSRVRVLTSTTGQGNSITLGDAFSAAFCTEVEAGAGNGKTYSYIIEKGNDFERNRGVYDSGTRTIGRGTPRKSKIGGTAGTTKLDLDGTATVRFVHDAEDIDEKIDKSELPAQIDAYVAPTAAAESDNEITLDVDNGNVLFHEKILDDDAEVQIPLNMPDGRTIYFLVDPDGNELTWASGFEGSNNELPSPTEETLFAIIRKGSRYLVIVAGENFGDGS